MEQSAPTPAPTEQPVAPVLPVPPVPGTPSKSNGLAIAALVLGIIAFLFGWLGFLNLLIAILAVVFGILALVKHQSKGLALTGTILGGLGLLTSLIVGLISGAAFLSSLSQQTSTGSNSSSSSSSISEGADAATGAWDVNTAYEKVQTGMTKAQIEDATGKKSESCASSESQYGKYETCYYGGSFDDNGTITVSYTDDKVSSKSKYSNDQ